MMNQGENQAGSNTAGLAMREKCWSERDVEQKLNALRENLLGLKSLCEMQQTALRQLMKHGHDSNGNLTTALRDVEFDHIRSHVPMALRDKP